MKSIKPTLTVLAMVIVFTMVTFYAESQRTRYSGSHHTYSHGGHYSGASSGSSHKGGHYKHASTSNHYGRHKK